MAALVGKARVARGHVRGIWSAEDGVVTQKSSGQPSHEPVHRVVAGIIALHRFRSLLAAANFRNPLCGRPFLGVSFRAFTASPNAEKGTPTAQRFDNRSIA